MRTDTGALWENVVIAERLKFLSNKQQIIKPHFWRTYTGAKIAYIEEKDGILTAFKLNSKKERKKAPQTWIDNYGNNFHCITINNLWEYLTS